MGVLSRNHCQMPMWLVLWVWQAVAAALRPAVKRVCQLVLSASAASDSHVSSFPGLKAPALSSIAHLQAVSVWHDMGGAFKHSLVCAVICKLPKLHPASAQCLDAAQPLAVCC